jgi:hypothetical protein
LVVQSELEEAGDHDGGIRTMPILEKREAQRLSAIDKKAAAEPVLTSHDPLAAAVAANEHRMRSRAASRGRFAFVHDTFSFQETITVGCVLRRFLDERKNRNPVIRIENRNITVRINATTVNITASVTISDAAMNAVVEAIG